MLWCDVMLYNVILNVGCYVVIKVLLQKNQQRKKNREMFHNHNHHQRFKAKNKNVMYVGVKSVIQMTGPKNLSYSFVVFDYYTNKVSQFTSFGSKWRDQTILLVGFIPMMWYIHPILSHPMPFHPNQTIANRLRKARKRDVTICCNKRESRESILPSFLPSFLTNE